MRQKLTAAERAEAARRRELWAAQTRQINRQKRGMLLSLNKLVGVLGCRHSSVSGGHENDDWKASVLLTRGDGGRAWVEYSIEDAYESDDQYARGSHGALCLRIGEEPSGKVLVHAIPENYGPRLWLDYGDDGEWDCRAAMLSDLIDRDFYLKLRDWLADGRAAARVQSCHAAHCPAGLSRLAHGDDNPGTD